jgi:hypothetical protein
VVGTARLLFRERHIIMSMLDMLSTLPWYSRSARIGGLRPQCFEIPVQTRLVGIEPR